MRDLVGRSFAIADIRYRVVDVQRLGADALVFTERLLESGRASGGDPVPGPRTAFHYRDIAEALAAGTQA